MRIASVAAVWLMCACSGAASDSAPLTTAEARPPLPPSAIPPERRCGEVGATPTALPPGLSEGTGRLGEVTVARGQTKNVGSVEIQYDESAWIGTMEVGHRGPAVVVHVDRAEVGEHQPWGGMDEVAARSSHRFQLGPYRIDTRASGETPPLSVTAVVERRACEDHTVQGGAPGAVSMWLSTEAIRLHTLDFDADMLQVQIDSNAHAGPRMEVRRRGWMQWLVPQPGETRRFQLDDRVITIDEVTAGRGTVFDGAWRGPAGGPPRVHARVGVAPVVVERDASRQEAVACGVASPVATRVPAALGAALRQTADVEIGVGEQRAIAGLEVRVISTEDPPLPSHRYRREPPGHTVTIQSTPPMYPTPTFAYGRVARARTERALVRIDPVVTPAGAPERYRLRTYAAACAQTLVVPSADRPVYVWLSTIGTSRVFVGTADHPVLDVQITSDDTSPGFLASSEHGYDIRTLTPTLPGHISTMDTHNIEVLDLVAPTGATFEESRWTGTDPYPIFHIQVRISRD